MYGREPDLPQEILESGHTPHYGIGMTTEVSWRQDARFLTKWQKKRSPRRHIRKVEQDKKPVEPQFQVRDWVYLKAEHNERGLSRKRVPKWKGPYRICGVLYSVVYRVWSCQKRQHGFNVDTNRLKKKDLNEPESQEQEESIALPFHSVEPTDPRVMTEDELQQRHVHHSSGRQLNETQDFVVDEALHNGLADNPVPRTVEDQMSVNAVEVPMEPCEFLVQPDTEVPRLVEDLTEADMVKVAAEPCESLLQPDNEGPHLIWDQREPAGTEAVPPPTMSAESSGGKTIRSRLCRRPSYLQDYVI